MHKFAHKAALEYNSFRPELRGNRLPEGGDSTVELQKKSLLEARDQWRCDIKMYKEFLEGEPQTFQERYGAEEYISMAENRLIEINQKLKEMENK